MFVVIFTHVRPVEEVDRHREAHFAYIDRRYAEGVYLLSGRREPRNGAVILAAGDDPAAMEEIVRADPFIRAGVARYEIVPFLPGRAAPSLAALLPPSAGAGQA
ncbi:MAG: YciI family protein [Sphingobium sp.]